MASLSRAQTVSWDGGGGDLNWNNPQNWSGKALPGNSDDVVINVPPNVTVVCPNGAIIRSMQCTGSFSLAGGTFTLTGGSSMIAGDLLTSPGTSISANGTGVTFVANGTALTSGSSLYASAGAVIELPGVRQATFGSSASWQADGSGSRIVLSGLTNLTSSVSEWVRFRTTGGGRLEMMNLANITDGYVDIYADGDDTLVDLSSLQTYQPVVGYMRLQAYNNSTIRVSRLSDGRAVQVDRRAGGDIPIAQFFRLNGFTQVGGSASLAGLTNLDFTVGLYASEGAVVELPKVAEATCSAGTTWQADGVGSRLVFAGLTNLTSSSSGWLYLRTYGGGRLDLGRISRITDGYVDVYADGDGSVVDLSVLATYQPGVGYSSLRANNNGTILVPNLLDGRSIQVDRTSGGSIPVSQFLRLAGFSQSGGSASLTGLTNLDFTTRLIASAGALVDVPGVRQAVCGAPTTWQAEGSGSRLVLNGLTNLTGFNWEWVRLRAFSGGQLVMSNLVSITDGHFEAYADGDNSIVDLSSLQTYQPTTGIMSLLAYNNGAVLVPKLVDGRSVQADRRAGGNIPVAQFFRLNGFTQAGGSAILSGLTNLDSTARLFAIAGAVVEMPGAGQVACSGPTTWQAEGSGSRLVLNGLTNLTGFNWEWVRLRAFSGGQLVMSNLVSIADGYSEVYADGDNSIVDLSSLQSYQPSNGYMSLLAYNNGAVLVPKLSDGRSVQVDRRAGGNIPVAQFFRLNGFTQAGGSAILSGLTNLGSTARLLAIAGAVVDVPEVGQAVCSAPTIWQAEGSGSRLVLNGLTKLTGFNSDWLHLRAFSGGQLVMSNLVSITDGYVEVYADGDNSIVDLSSLQTYQPTNGYMSLLAYNNGAVLVPKLVDGGSVQVDRRAGGNIPVAQFFRLNGFTQTGGSASLSGLTNLDSTSRLIATAGAVVEVPGISQATSSGRTMWLAEGAGSRLVLSGLTNLTALTWEWVHLRAFSGGQLILSNITSITDGNVEAYADGDNSAVDLSALQTYQPTNGLMSLLADNNGAVLVQKLADGRAVQVDRRAGGSIPIAQFFRLNQFSQSGGSASLTGLTNLDSTTRLYATSGAVVDVPAVGQAASRIDTTWQADGAGSRVMLTGLTNLTSSSAAWLHIRATSGGRLELGNVTSITDGYAEVIADGNNSVVDLSHLSGFVMQNGQGRLDAVNGGVILLNDEAWLLANVAINIQSGNPVLPPALIASPTLTLYGKTWNSYWIEKRDTSAKAGAWEFVARVPLTNTFQAFAPTPKPNTAYRVREFVADPAILDINLINGTDVQLVLYGQPQISFDVQSAQNIDVSPVVWSPLVATDPMTNSFRILPPLRPAGTKQFYRSRKL